MKINKEFILREIMGEYILVPSGSDSQRYQGVISMNEQAVCIWNHLKDANTVDDLVDAITAEYEVEPDVASKDIREFLDVLRQHGIIS
ncbi:MAG: PqqD family protein [Bacillota bacterium]|nr:PqqD family protein [Bacillota bacterium]